MSHFVGLYMARVVLGIAVGGKSLDGEVVAPSSVVIRGRGSAVWTVRVAVYGLVLVAAQIVYCGYYHRLVGNHDAGCGWMVHLVHQFD